MYDYELARDATTQDLFGHGTDSLRPVRELYWGTAGWDQDQPVEDLGSSQNDGRTLLRVTVYDGKPLGRQIQNGLASGHQVLVQVIGPLFAIPPYGTQIACAFPGGDIETPGNGFVIGWAQSSPTQQFKASRAVLDLGPNIDLVLKGHSVLLSDHGADNPGTASTWLMVGPIPGATPGIVCNDRTGSGFTICNGAIGIYATDGGHPATSKAVIQVSQTGIGMLVGASSPMFQLNSDGTVNLVTSAQVTIMGQSVSLGATPSALTPALWGTSGMTGVASTSVFISI